MVVFRWSIGQADFGRFSRKFYDNYPVLIPKLSPELTTPYTNFSWQKTVSILYILSLKISPNFAGLSFSDIESSLTIVADVSGVNWVRKKGNEIIHTGHLKQGKTFMCQVWKLCSESDTPSWKEVLECCGNFSLKFSLSIIFLRTFCAINAKKISKKNWTYLRH